MEGSSSRKIRNICVFGGSSYGKIVEYTNAANDLGRVLAEQRIHLIYGGGNRGLKGCVATATYAGGSQVLGIIPIALAEEEIVGKTIGEEMEVRSMHARIARMVCLADAFIVLPGGFGTLEETFQIVSWSSLNLHQKPIGLLNVNNFFDGLLSFLDHAVEQKFISHLARKILLCATSATELINKLEAFVHQPDALSIRIDWRSDDDKKKCKLDLNLHL